MPFRNVSITLVPACQLGLPAALSVLDFDTVGGGGGLGGSSKPLKPAAYFTQLCNNSAKASPKLFSVFFFFFFLLITNHHQMYLVISKDRNVPLRKDTHGNGTSADARAHINMHARLKLNLICFSTRAF